LAGECILSHSKAISLMSGDYLNLEGYFCQKEQVQSKYRVISSKMTTCSLTFDYINKLPEEFREKLSFVHECHSIAPISFKPLLDTSTLLSLSRIAHPFKKNPLLPKVKREVRFGSKDKTLNCFRERELRNTFN
jgi:hypothetical protein